MACQSAESVQQYCQRCWAQEQQLEQEIRQLEARAQHLQQQQLSDPQNMQMSGQISTALEQLNKEYEARHQQLQVFQTRAVPVLSRLPVQSRELVDYFSTSMHAHVDGSAQPQHFEPRTSASMGSASLHWALRLCVDTIVNVCGSSDRARRFSAEVRRLVLDFLCEQLARSDVWSFFKTLDLLSRMFSNREHGNTWPRKKDADYLKLVSRTGRVADALNPDGHARFQHLFEQIVQEYDADSGNAFMTEEWLSTEFHERAAN
ncbi:unnamed protein product [Amoebophrya sp. A25]|nr:unnamed protein product [Amoebophrya sp. A25]|eukprot:GSA25T00007651001.1